MSQFTEDAPETLDDWNAVLSNGCCCTMPECPVPTKECQSLTGSATPAGFFDEEDETPTLYSRDVSRITYTYSETVTDDHPGGGTYTVVSGSGSGIEDFIMGYFAPTGGLAHAELYVGGCISRLPDYSEYCDGSGSYTRSTYVPDGGTGVWLETERSVTWTDVGGEDNGIGGNYPDCWYRRDETYQEYTGGEPDGDPDNSTTYDENLAGWPTGTTTDSSSFYEDGLTWSAWLSATITALGALMDFEDEDNSACLDDECASTHTSSEASWETLASSLTLRKVRFRWAIPDTFEGSYFKRTWDVAFYPAGGGDPVAVSKDNTWEWSGPGDPEDPDSWKSGWYDIPVPTEPGENRVINCRRQCYHGASFGVLPQVDGEGYDWPPEP